MIKDNVHQIKCVSNCDKQYASFKSLRNHVKSCWGKNEISCSTYEQTNLFEEQTECENPCGITVPLLPAMKAISNDSLFTFGEKNDDKNIDDFLDLFTTEVIMLKLNSKSTNAVFNLCRKLMDNMQIFCENSVNREDMFKYVSNKLSSMNSEEKRKKFFKNNENFVKPVEKAIGLHFEMKRECVSGIKLPTQVQSKFQFVSISQTLISLFDQTHFRKLYLDYNSDSELLPQRKRKHICEFGRYRDFCCGKVFKKNPLFMAYPNSIQIQLFIDGFEVCDPLKPRANVHNQVGIYFAIRNLPHRLAFNQSNIHLAAMCYANDLKTEYTDYNNLWDEIVRDVSFLEENGLVLDSQNKLLGKIKNDYIFQMNSKFQIMCLDTGTVMDATFDNLGGNSSLGFVESFRATYYCRICTMSREECEQATKEDTSKYRTQENYSDALQIIKDSSHVDFKDTRGIKTTCSLNKLKYFHIIDNYNVDLMHDIYEGTVPFLLENLIEHCVSKKVFTFNEIAAYVENFDYGKLNRRNIPSTLLEKKGIGQNSSQVRCLMLHLPFIFFDFKEHPIVKKLWVGVESMLKIIKIVHSADLYENDLIELGKAVSVHLSFIKTVFGSALRPKHHFMLHYETVIRMVGPIVHMSTMRYEAKHKAFTDQAKTSNNFMNIGQWIVLRNQQFSSLKTKYEDNISIGKLRKIDQAISYAHEQIIRQYFREILEVKITTWAQVNSNYYSKNFFISHENTLFEIRSILHFRNDLYLLCSKFQIVVYDSFLNSVIIREMLPNDIKIIKESDLNSPKSYERKLIDSRTCIIVDTLDIDRIISTE